MSFFTHSFQIYLIGGIFIVTGILHFIRPDTYVKIMPDYIPYHLAMVYISGVAEFFGGLGILIPELRVLASWGLIILLFAVFPANIEMTVKGYKNHGFTLYTWLTIARLPLQFVFMYWIYKAGIEG